MLAFVPVLLYPIALAVLVPRLAVPADPGLQPATRPASLLALLAASVHATIAAAAIEVDGGLSLGFFAALSAVAAVVALLAAGLALVRADLAALGMAVYPLAAACQLAFALQPGTATSAVSAWQIQVHAALALLAYAALSLAALLAIMLWLQERALRQRSFTRLQRLLPPLTQLESLLFRLIAAGFALLTLALITGAVFVENLFAQHLVHKTVLSLLAWAVFGALLLGRLRHGWRGRRAVRWTLAAMALLALSFFGSKFVLELLLQRG